VLNESFFAGYVYEMTKGRNASRATGGAQKAASYHHGDLRDALIAAAQTILERDGAAALSLRAVARIAGVSVAAPYHHFSDKQALLDAVAERGFAALTGAMRERMERAKGAQARLDASGVGYVAFATKNPALFGLMFSAAGHEGSTAAAAARARSYAILQGAADAASPRGKASPLECLRLWSVVHGIAKLVIEGCVAPGDYGVADAEKLAALMFSRGRGAHS